MGKNKGLGDNITDDEFNIKFDYLNKKLDNLLDDIKEAKAYFNKKVDKQKDDIKGIGLQIVNKFRKDFLLR